MTCIQEDSLLEDTVGTTRDVFEEALKHQTLVHVSGQLREVSVLISGRAPAQWWPGKDQHVHEQAVDESDGEASEPSELDSDAQGPSGMQRSDEGPSRSASPQPQQQDEPDGAQRSLEEKRSIRAHYISPTPSMTPDVVLPTMPQPSAFSMPTIKSNDSFGTGDTLSNVFLAFSLFFHVYDRLLMLGHACLLVTAYCLVPANVVHDDNALFVCSSSLILYLTGRLASHASPDLVALEEEVGLIRTRFVGACLDFGYSQDGMQLDMAMQVN